MKKIIIYIISIIVIIGGIVFFIYMKNVGDYKKKIKNIVINEPDLSTISDGKYTGECDCNLIHAKVEVEIENHKYKDIKLLKHENGKGSKASSITQKVLDSQSLKVDTVSGATNSSKVILKAISNALE